MSMSMSMSMFCRGASSHCGNRHNLQVRFITQMLPDSGRINGGSVGGSSSVALCRAPFPVNWNKNEERLLTDLPVVTGPALKGRASFL